jgi:hypothetical protein
VADVASAAGVKWMILDVRWSFVEPQAPQATPFPGSVTGPRRGHHRYDFSGTDRWIHAATSRGMNVVIRFYMHPTWAGGQSCAGLEPPCGRILFRNGTCDASESSIAAWTHALYRDMNWQRSFFNAFLDSSATCGFGLVHSPIHPSVRLAPKSTLYPRFRAIVNGTYPQSSTLAEIENTTVTHYTDESGNPPPLSREERLLLHGQPFGTASQLEAAGVSGLIAPESASDRSSACLCRRWEGPAGCACSAASSFRPASRSVQTRAGSTSASSSRRALAVRC